MKKKHPYQRVGFWKDNQFWNDNSETYSKQKREELDKWADSLYTTKTKLEFINRIKK